MFLLNQSRDAAQLRRVDQDLQPLGGGGVIRQPGLDPLRLQLDLLLQFLCLVGQFLQEILLLLLQVNRRMEARGSDTQRDQ